MIAKNTIPNASLKPVAPSLYSHSAENQYDYNITFQKGKPPKVNIEGRSFCIIPPLFSKNDFIIEVISCIRALCFVDFAVIEGKTDRFIVLRCDQIAVCADDDSFQAFILPDSPQCFQQLQSPVAPPLVFSPDPVMSYLNVVRPMPRIPCHKADGFPVQAGDQPVFIGNFRMTVKEIIGFFQFVSQICLFL